MFVCLPQGSLSHGLSCHDSFLCLAHLAEANEADDRRMYADFSQVLIAIARPLCAGLHQDRSVSICLPQGSLSHGLSCHDPFLCLAHLAEANEADDWRMYAHFSQVLIAIARPLCADGSLGLDLE